MHIHQVEFRAQPGQRGIRDPVQTGDHRFEAEFIFDEIDLPVQHAPLQFEQKFPEQGLVVALPPFLPLREFAAVEGRDFRIRAPIGAERVFIDQAQRDQRGVFPPGEAGVGIPVRHPGPYEILPAFHRMFVDGQLRFQPPTAGDGAFEVPVDIEVGGHVEAVLFALGKKVVEFIQRFRIQFHGIRNGGIDQPPVVMVKADGVVAHADQILHQLVGDCLVEKVGGEAEVGAVETDLLLRRIFKNEFALIVGTNETVLAGRCILRHHGGEIQRTARQDPAPERQLFPIGPLFDGKRTFFPLRENERPVAERHSGNYPRGFR